ncbi:unnamed protein product, partial [Iphiclides podalirius]
MRPHALILVRYAPDVSINPIIVTSPCLFYLSYNARYGSGGWALARLVVQRICTTNRESPTELYSIPQYIAKRSLSHRGQVNGHTHMKAMETHAFR